MIQFQPLSADLYQIPKAQILFAPQGSTALELLGDADDVTLEVATEVTERYSNEYGTRTLVKTIVNQITSKLGLTLVQISDRVRALSILSSINYDTQSLVSNHIQNLVAPLHAGHMYKLDHFDIDPEGITVTDSAGSPVAYTLGTHYKIDSEAGIIQLLLKPNTANGNVKITYDAVEIVADDLRAKMGLGSNTDNRGRVIIRGTNDVGPRTYIELNDVKMLPSSARNLISDTDFTTIEIEGTVYADGTKAAGYELGFERTLAAIPAEVET